MLPNRRTEAYVFGYGSDLSHAQDGDPDGTDRPEEVAVLQGVVVHNAQNGDTRLVTRVIELREMGKMNVDSFLSHFYKISLKASLFLDALNAYMPLPLHSK